MDILVDSNVILDIVTEDKKWFPWSSETLAKYVETHTLVINPVIYAEVSIGFKKSSGGPSGGQVLNLDIGIKRKIK